MFIFEDKKINVRELWITKLFIAQSVDVRMSLCMMMEHASVKDVVSSEKNMNINIKP